MTRPPNIELRPADNNGGPFVFQAPPPREVERLTIQATPARDCPACEHRRRHSEAEWRVHHPLAGHGCNNGRWSFDPKEGS